MGFENYSEFCIHIYLILKIRASKRVKNMNLAVIKLCEYSGF